MIVDEILSKLNGVRPTGTNKWQALCPAHYDHTPSLSIATGEDDCILLKCFAGCSCENICKSIGIEQRDLFAKSQKKASNRDIFYWETQTPIAIYDYHDEEGNLLFQMGKFLDSEGKKTLRPRRPDGKNWRYEIRGIRRVLYRLPELLQSKPDEPLFIVEGEKDADSCASIGLVATTNPFGGSAKWSKLAADNPLFDAPLHKRRIMIMPDNDQTGQSHADDVKRSLYGKAAEIRIVNVPDGCKDISEWLEAHDSIEPEILRKQILDWCDQAQVYDPAKTAVEGELVMTPLSTVEAKEVQWFWENRIPANMLSLIVGNPGVGKSFLTMFITATITSGRDWPDSKNSNPAGTVLLFSDEESTEHAIKPRLEKNGADCSKIFVFDHVKLKSGERGFFNIQDRLGELEKCLDKMPDCRLIIFDPLTAYLGDADANCNAEVRVALLGLQNLAQRRKVTIIGVNHLSKKADLDVIHRVLGSIGFVAASRSVWAVAFEKDDNQNDGKQRRVMVPVKSNYSINPDGLSFEIVDGAVCFDKMPMIQDIDRLFSKKKTSGMEARAKYETIEWLKEQLADNTDKSSAAIFEAAEANGISIRILKAVKKTVGVRTYKSGFGKCWMWTLRHAAEKDTDQKPKNVSQESGNNAWL